MLQPPTAKRQQAGLETLERLCGIEAVLKIALEYVGPEIHPLRRHGLQRQPAIWAKIVVGHERAGKTRRLLLFRSRQSLGLDNLVLFVDLFALEHHIENHSLEFVGK